jgi:hypothetical protein
MATQRKEYISAFVEMANKHTWDYWTTFTLNRPMSIASARRLSQTITNDFCQPTAFKHTGLLWVAEPFDAKVGYHIHALLSSALTIKAILERKAEKPQRYGRIHIEPYDAKRGAKGYCAKYITKQLSDWDIYLHDYFSKPKKIERIEGVKFIDYSKVNRYASAESTWELIELNKL